MGVLDSENKRQFMQSNMPFLSISINGRVDIILKLLTVSHRPSYH